MADNTQDANLAKALIEQSMITEQQLTTARDYQESIGGELFEVLIKLGFLSAVDLQNLLESEEEVEESATLDLSKEIIDSCLMGHLGEAYVLKHGILPCRRSADSVVLAMGEPMDFHAIDQVQALTSSKVEVVQASLPEIHALAAEFFTLNPDLSSMTNAESLADQLLGQVSDKLVAAALRALVKQSALDPQVWFDELEKQNSTA